MKCFSEWVNEYGNIPANVKGPGLADNGDNALPEIIKIAWLQHRKETEAFFHGLSQQNPDIKHLFERLMNKPSNGMGDYQDFVTPGTPDPGNKDLPPI
jgi:hypothetical protein